MKSTALCLLLVTATRAWALDPVLDVRIVTGARPTDTAWTVAAPATADEQRAVALASEVLAGPAFADRLRRMHDDVAAVEGALGGPAKSFTSGGKVLVLLATDQPAWGTEPEVGCATLLEGQGPKLYALVGARGLDRETLEQALHEALPQLDQVLAEAAFALGYKTRQRDAGWWTAKAGESGMFATADAAGALVDGAAAAVEVSRFQSQLAKATGDAHLAGGSAAAYRAYLPPGNRLLVRLAELASSSDTAELAQGAAEWPDPAFERDGSLRAPDAMLACPAFVATVLADLYDGALITRHAVQAAIQRGQGLDDILKNVKPARADVVAQLVARRAHGANLDAAAAQANVADLRAHRQSAEAFAKRHQAIVAPKAKAAAPAAVIADDLKQLPLDIIPCHDSALASVRVRALAGANVDPETQVQVAVGMQNALTLRAVQQAFGAPAQEEEEDGVNYYHKAVESAHHPVIEAGLEKIFPEGVSEALEHLEKSANVLDRANAVMVKGGASCAVVEILVHQVLEHNYGFLACREADAGTKALLTAKVICQWNFHWIDALTIGAHAGIFAAASGLAVLGGIAVGFWPAAIGIAAVLVVDLVAKVVIDGLKESHHEALARDIGDRVSRWSETSPDDRGQLTDWLGAVGQVDSAEYDCAKAAEGDLVFTKIEGFQDGALKDWLAFEDGKLGTWLAELSRDVAGHKEELDRAQSELAFASNPLVNIPGFWEKAAFFAFRVPPSRFNSVEAVVPLLAIDKDGHDVSAREIADHITYLSLAAQSTPENPLEKVSDAHIDELEAQYERQVGEVLARTRKSQLLADHYDAKADFEKRVESHRADFFRAMDKMREWLRHDAADKLAELAEKADAQRLGMERDLKVGSFEAIPELSGAARFLLQRKASLETLVTASRNTARALRVLE